MHLEEFAEGASLWHRMDPRVKIVGVACFAVVTAVSHELVALSFALAVALVALFSARLDLKKVAIRLGAVNLFVAFLWFFLPFTTPGHEIASFGPLTVKSEGLALALGITMKANAVMSALIALLGTSTVFSLVHALTHIYVPEKLVQLFFFCYRYISTIHEEYTRLRSSMRIRSFTPKANLHTYRSAANLLGMLFVRSFERSQRIYQAMLLRGFNGTFWTLNHFHMHRSDWWALTGMALCVLTVAGLEITGGTF
jgi:cobalt/nickel transport system permease protein